MEQLKSHIRIIPDFPKPGISFKDIAPLLANPAARSLVISELAARWHGKADAIAALDARGFVFGSALAHQEQLPFVMIRKAGKLPGSVRSHAYGLEYGNDVLEIQEGALPPGARVLVVDDLLASGGTAAAACALIESVGGVVAGCAFVIELSGLGGREALGKHAVDSLVSY